MNEFFDPVMAIDASELCVDRFVEGIGRENRHRNGFAIDLARVGRVGMAIEAIVVGELLGRRRAETDQQGEAEEPAGERRLNQPGARPPRGEEQVAPVSGGLRARRYGNRCTRRRLHLRDV